SNWHVNTTSSRSPLSSICRRGFARIGTHLGQIASLDRMWSAINCSSCGNRSGVWSAKAFAARVPLPVRDGLLQDRLDRSPPGEQRCRVRQSLPDRKRKQCRTISPRFAGGRDSCEADTQGQWPDDEGSIWGGACSSQFKG